MASNLHYNAVSSLLLEILKILMGAKEFKDFRLVGGTALSLYRGHRESVDIDLFTDAPYDVKGGNLDHNMPVIITF